jgi:hypothetical protein
MRVSVVDSEPAESPNERARVEWFSVLGLIRAALPPIPSFLHASYFVHSSWSGFLFNGKHKKHRLAPLVLAHTVVADVYSLVMAMGKNHCEESMFLTNK